jgi:hypothetical protein
MTIDKELTDRLDLIAKKYLKAELDLLDHGEHIRSLAALLFSLHPPLRTVFEENLAREKSVNQAIRTVLESQLKALGQGAQRQPGQLPN